MSEIHRGLAGDLALPCAYAVSAVLIAALKLAGGLSHPTLALALFAALTAWTAALAGPRRALGAALICWLFHDGFVINRMSDLAWGPADRTALAVLLAAAALGACASAAIRWKRRHARARRVPARARPLPRPVNPERAHGT